MAVATLPVRYYRNYPAENPLGTASKVMAIDPAFTVLLLVDVYHAAQKPEGAELVHTVWDQAWRTITDENIPPLIEAARDARIPIVYAMNSAPRIEMGQSPFGKRLKESMGFNPEIHFREEDVDPREYAHGDPMQLLIPEQIAPQEGDYYIRKHTYSAFFETRLNSLLSNLGAKFLLCAGFVANCCLMFTMADAMFRGFEVILVRDCTLATEPPDEVAEFRQTQQSIIWTETFLGPSATAQDIVRALERCSAARGK
jgi:nicotinamidase-related amidase